LERIWELLPPEAKEGAFNIIELFAAMEAPPTVLTVRIKMTMKTEAAETVTTTLTAPTMDAASVV
jgi:hypothetical protein